VIPEFEGPGVGLLLVEVESQTQGREGEKSRLSWKKGESVAFTLAPFLSTAMEEGNVVKGEGGGCRRGGTIGPSSICRVSKDKGEISLVLRRRLGVLEG